MDKRYIYEIVPVFDTDLGERGIEIEYTSKTYLGIELPYETAMKIARECLTGETIKKIEFSSLESVKAVDSVEVNPPLSRDSDIKNVRFGYYGDGSGLATNNT